MNNRIANSRFVNQISWPTVFVASGLVIGVPYLIRRFGLFSNLSASSVRPQELVSRAADAARSVADRVGINIPSSNQDTTARTDASTTDASLSH